MADLVKAREEQARAEVGHTDVSPRLAAFLVFFFLAVIVAVPLMDQIYDAVTKGGTPAALEVTEFIPPADVITNAYSDKGLLATGFAVNAHLLREIKRYEDGIKQDSLLAETMLPSVQNVTIGYLKAGNEKAYCGLDGWLFYRPGIDFLTGGGFLEPVVMAKRARAGDETHEPPQPDPVKAIMQFRDQLAERGITLVLFPAPDKAAVYPEKLSRRYDGRQPVRNPSEAEFYRRLQEAGVLICDVTEALTQAKGQGVSTFLKTDTHWTPEGMEMAARGLARFIREQAPLPGISPVLFTRTSKTVENLGDVAVMLKLLDDQTFYIPERAMLQTVRQSDGAPWEADPGADILLLGDSFANIYSLGGMGWGEHAGLAEQLSVELDRPIDTLLINDNASHATRRQLSREIMHGKDRLAGKKLVIWEFAARELAVGDWKVDFRLNPVHSAR
ncbi:MAG TPA: hypothetical protein PLI09_21745 [Candidatus Hydrogenedentes bacterium]|nr:hypothetical protein [Candidatus Hydrogenedentota bacterium]